MVPYTIFVSCLSLGLPILFMGIFLFIYSKKEGLGILFKIASYSAIICGTIVFLSGVYFASIANNIVT
jgi:hypothetical protein